MTGTYSPHWRAWAPPGTPAFSAWICGRCSAELINTDPRVCETCGARYQVETGEYLGGSGRPADPDTPATTGPHPAGWDPCRPIGEQLLSTVDDAQRWMDLAHGTAGTVDGRAWALLRVALRDLRARTAAAAALADDADRRGGGIDPAALRTALRPGTAAHPQDRGARSGRPVGRGGSAPADDPR